MQSDGNLKKPWDKGTCFIIRGSRTHSGATIQGMNCYITLLLEKKSSYNSNGWTQ